MYSGEDWNALLSYMPSGWEDLAVATGALTRAREFKSGEDLLRVLLIHIAQGCSLRETAVRAKRGGIVNVSDVAILKRLRKSEAWLLALCRALCGSPEPVARIASRHRLVAVDATCVSEPGSTGTDWRMHYSLELPSLACEHFELSDATGAEKLERFSFKPGDLALADRIYSTVSGIRHVLNQNADVLVRIKTSQTNFFETGSDKRIDLIAAADALQENQTQQWEATLRGKNGQQVSGWLSILRRPEQVAELERAKIEREARKKNRKPRARTLQAASIVGLFTTCPGLSAQDCFAVYRFRWQVEIAFKRLKTLTGFGHLPKRDPSSCRAWLYGKLLVGLLAEKMSQTAFFP